ncbi:MAG: UDP-glucose 4-epimerase GalE [Paludibacteraceae bacterium]|nr:UDP-glucose 4-epimerase GalE [Paludibacteraceae bacterium]
MTVLVTGGTGYIGSHTCIELIGAGYEVVIMDNLSNSTAQVLDAIGQITGKRPAFWEADCCDAQAVESVFAAHPDIRAVIHFAASKSVNESQAKPLQYYRNNLLSLIRILEAMQRHSAHCLVFSSSCTVYGESASQPVNEQTPLQPPTSPYGATKQICEQIIADSVKAGSGLRASILRYFNPIGAHASGLIGESPLDTPQNLVPLLCRAAAGKSGRLQVFGNDYDTPDGSCIRDYIHVSDLGQAHLAALTRLQSGKAESATEIFNIGTGKGFSVLELIRTFEAVNGVKVPYDIASRRPGDIARIWADTRLAQEKLGWKAHKSIEDCLQSAWLWQTHCTQKH